MKKYIKCTLISIGIGIISLIIVLASFAGIMAKVGATDTLIITTILLSMMTCGFVCGYINGQFIKEKGIYIGLASGGIVSVVLFILKFVFSSDIITVMTFVKLIILIVFAVIGGIVGVNKNAKINYSKIK